MPAFASPLFWHIQQLVEAVSDENFNNTVQELSRLCEFYGLDARIFLLACILVQSKTKQQQPKQQKQYSLQIQLLTDEIEKLAKLPNFAGTICNLFEHIAKVDIRNVLVEKPSQSGQQGVDIAQAFEKTLQNICETAKLPTNLQISLALALVYSPHPETAKGGINYLIKVLRNYPSSASPLPHSTLHSLLYLLRTHEGFQGDPALQSNAVSALEAAHPHVASSSTLFPVAHGMVNLSDDDPKAHESSLDDDDTVGIASACLAGTLTEVGYAATYSEEVLRAVFAACGIHTRDRGGAPLNEVDVAKCLVRMGNTVAPGTIEQMPVSMLRPFLVEGSDDHSLALDDQAFEQSTWNMGVFVSVLNEDHPYLNWTQIVRALDLPDVYPVGGHRDNIIRDNNCFHFVVNAYKMATGRGFPTKEILRSWRNARAQIALLEHAVVAEPSVLTFADAGPLIAPVEGFQSGCGTANQCWCCVTLYSCLLRLAHVGGLEGPVVRLLELGQSKCSQLVLLGLAHAKSDCGVESAMEDSHPLRTRAYDSILTKYFRNLVTPSESQTGSLQFQCPKVEQHQLSLLHRLWGISPPLTVNSLLRLAAAMARNMTQQSRDRQGDSIKNSFTCISRVVLLLQQYSFKDSTRCILYAPAQPEMAIQCAIAVFMKQHEMDTGKSLRNDRLPYEARLAPEWKDGEITLSTGNNSPIIDEDGAVNLEAWIQEQLVDGKPIFAQAFVSFIKQAIKHYFICLSAKAGTEEDLAIPVVIFTDICTVGCSCTASVESKTVEEVRSLYDAACQRLPVIGDIRKRRIRDLGRLLVRCVTSRHSLGSNDKVKALDRFRKAGRLQAEIFEAFTLTLVEECKAVDHSSEERVIFRGEVMGYLVREKMLRQNEIGLIVSSAVDCLKSVQQNNGSKKLATLGVSVLRTLREELLQWPELVRHLLQLPVLEQLDQNLRLFLENNASGSSSSSSQPVMSAASASSSTAARTDTSRATNQETTPSTSAPSASDPKAEVEAEKRKLYKQRVKKLFDELGGGLSSFLAAAVRGDPLPGLQDSLETEGQDGAMEHPEPSVAALDVDKLIRPFTHISQAASPPTAIVDKLHFLVNNLTESNLETKLPTAKELIQAEYRPWLANFLVSKRVATQPNFHNLYLTFLDRLNDADLNHEIYLATLENIRRTLQSEKILSSTQERTVLKNMGSWLGKVTLARNKPLLQRDVDLKEMLFQAYETGRLIAVMPFIAKVLEPVAESLVFSWPNPWTAGLIAALREIYTVPDLKLNLKFEVEVLCKHIGVEAKDIPVKTDLQKRKRPILSGNPDFNVKAASNAPAIPGIPQKEAERLGEVSTPSNSSNESVGITDTPLIPKLEEIVDVTPGEDVFASPLRDKIQRATALAVEKSVLNLIEKVVGRSVTIACITTKELITKDFAFEPSISKLEASSHLMSSTLAGSLAGVTSCEALRTEINNNLKKILSAAGVNVEDSSIGKAVSQLASDNVDLGRMLLEKATMESATREIDAHLRESVYRRRQYLDQVKSGQANQQFADTVALSASSRWLSALPESLRPSPRGLDREQLKVYEAFAQLPAFEGTQPNKGKMDSLETAARDAPQATDLVAPSARESSGEKQSAQSDHQSVLNSYLQLFERLKAMVGQMIGSDSQFQLTSLSPNHPIMRTLEEMGEVARRGNTEDTEASTLKFARAVFLQMFQPVRETVYLQIYLGVLTSLRGAVQSISEYVNRWYNSLPFEQKLNRDAVVGLIRNSLLPIKDMDGHLVEVMEHGRGANLHGVVFACAIVDRCIVTEQIMSPSDIQKTMSALVTLARQRPCPIPALPAVVEACRKVQMGETIPSELRSMSAKAQEMTPSVSQPVATSAPAATTVQTNTAHGDSRSVAPVSVSQSHAQVTTATDTATKTAATNAASSVTGANDPEGVRRQVLYILEAWVRLTADGSNGTANESAYQQFLQLLQQQKVLSSDTDRFFRIMMELCVQSCNATCQQYPAETRPETSTSTHPRSRLQFTGVDAMSKFVVLLVRVAESSTARLTTLSRVSSVVVKTLFSDADTNAFNSSGQPGSFDQRPYLRLFCNLLSDLHVREGDPLKAKLSKGSIDQVDPESLQFNASVLSIFANLFHAIRPEKLPIFAFSWLDLVCHRMFMPKLLGLPGRQGWPLFHRLVMDLLHYLYPYLEKNRMTEGIRLLYRGTMRLFLVLLHDFAEFLCDYHLPLCNAIPPSCVQLRNLVLSAFPGSMRLPDPFTPNLKIDLLPEIKQPPRILMDPAKELGDLAQQLDDYMRTSGPASLLRSLKDSLMSQKISYPLTCRLNSLVLYVGMQAIQSGKADATQSPHLEVFHYLVNELDAPYRYLFLNAIANQLRYPNSHTHYFSSTLLRLFLEAKSMGVKEQITRVLLERLVAHRPHPWGLLITFIELVMNSKFDFWSHPFTKCAPQIERLFESVARSCIGSNANSSTTTSVSDSSQTAATSGSRVS
eukprot:gb/GECG01012836.1/.p1 GENE.gb/GECG01012836.1/~~gb/GECG01012836.1/.p1  ORF type:complete len:2467 (+),score=278.86 gb/GECG01012836.1/:1-7401(+)